MSAVALGLLASLSWGVADFLGGLKSRTIPVVAVVAVSQTAGLGPLGLIVVLRGEGPPGGVQLAFAALSGLCLLVATASLYGGLAIGSMSIVAPLTAAGGLIPVSVDLALGQRPSWLQGLGLGLALVGVAAASRQPREERTKPRATIAPGVGLALTGALAFGGFYVFLERGSESDLPWALLTLRLVSVALVLAVCLVLRPAFPTSPRDVAPLVVIGFLDPAAHAAFAGASAIGLLSVAAVLTSLYPVTTVALARLVLRERLVRSQQIGVALVLAGVALVIASSS